MAQCNLVSYPEVVVPVEELGWQGCGILAKFPHFRPEFFVLRNIYLLERNFLPIKDELCLLLFGLNLKIISELPTDLFNILPLLANLTTA